MICPKPLPRHAPNDYHCPFCLLARGEKEAHLESRPEDIVYRDELVMAFVCSRQWPKNPGHVLVAPMAHYENIFDLPLSLATRIHQVARAVALAMKTAYDCRGISTRQHNEPCGGQEVWHYHLHIYPRYPEDGLYRQEKGLLMEASLRADYARRLRLALDGWQASGPG